MIFDRPLRARMTLLDTDGETELWQSGLHWLSPGETLTLDYPAVSVDGFRRHVRDDSHKVVEQGEGCQIIQLGPRKVALYEPWCAGQYDPPMQDWLKLPAGDSCPNGESHHWGTKNPIGYFKVRHCKDCGAEFRGKVTPRMIQEIVCALNGEPVRLAR